MLLFLHIILHYFVFVFRGPFFAAVYHTIFERACMIRTTPMISSDSSLFIIQVIRHYHGHLSACYALDLHPTIDILATCGRDATIRIWDMRSKACVHTLTGHTNTVASVKCQSAEPQVKSYWKLQNF